MEESASAETQEANAWVVNVNENPESEREANISSGNGSQSEGTEDEPIRYLTPEEIEATLIEDLKEEVEESSEPPVSPSSSPGICIYKVPHNIRELNERAYTPKYISIGPVYFIANETLRSTQQLKNKYLKIFVEKTGVNVELLVRTISAKENRIRRCYAETSERDHYTYLRLTVVDATFIIVFFLNKFEHAEWTLSDNEFTILTAQLMDDLSLLENQLPFFIIEELYNLAFASRTDYPFFIDITFDIFAKLNQQIEYQNLHHDPNLTILHFVDLLRNFCLPQPDRRPETNHGERVTHSYTASQLDEAGVKFEVSSSKCLFDLKFTNGVLEIPCLQVNYFTECFFRNIMALEQFHYAYDSYVSDYIRILDFLIDTAKDVDLLVQKKILVNNLGDSNAVATMVNNLNKGILFLNTNSNYCCLCTDLKKFYENPRHSWIVTLRREYFGNPWRIIATIAAVILLLLTLTQTVCSIISVL